uniref:Putative secreted protein n=1 Tax=Ixodes scapularis TaxID=6945 RepID=A0A4D5REZ4_IXOSC
MLVLSRLGRPPFLCVTVGFVFGFSAKVRCEAACVCVFEAGVLFRGLAPFVCNGWRCVKASGVVLSRRFFGLGLLTSGGFVDTSVVGCHTEIARSLSNCF